MGDSHAMRWVVVIVVVLALVALVAWARGDDGDDGRSPEHEDALAQIVEG